MTVETREVDFSKLELGKMQDLFSREKGDIKVVVNNVGAMVRDRFMDNNPQDLENLLKVNIFS